MWQCDGVGGWGKSAVKYRVCRCRCKTNDLMKKEKETGSPKDSDISNSPKMSSGVLIQIL